MGDTVMKNCRNKGPILGFCGLVLVPIILTSLMISTATAREITDKTVTVAVMRELETDEAVPAHLIDVESKDGLVTLSGSTNNLLAKERAGQVAGTLKGVRAVFNEIEVKPVERSDQEIREDVSTALAEDPAADEYEISVEMEEGMVALEGSVDSWQERFLCEKIAKGVVGVKGVENAIEVSKAEDVSDEEIRAEIKGRLEWDSWIDDAQITVDVKNGKATLGGKVGSVAEKERAFLDAWVFGVTSVDESNLEIDWSLRDPMRRHDPKTDEEIEKAFQKAVRYEPRLSGSDMDVYVDYGAVTLTGTVSDLKARRAAAEVAKNLVGVWRVKNHLRLKNTQFDMYTIGGTPFRYDEEIANKVRAALLRDPYVRQQDITVTVDQRRVILNGRVDSTAQKLRAEDIASSVDLAVAVNNNISVGRSWTEKEDWEIREDIKDEIWWSPHLDPDDISVVVRDRIATLIGVVTNLRERRLAAENAYEGGARHVRNHLRVINGPPFLRP